MNMSLYKSLQKYIYVYRLILYMLLPHYAYVTSIK